MKTQLLFCLVLLTVALTDCRKKADPDPNSPDAPRLSRVTNDAGQVLSEYGYGSDRKLTEFKQYFAGAPTALVTRAEQYTYDGQGRIERVAITSASGGTGSGTVSSSQTLSYNAAGKLEILSALQGSTPIGRTTFEYDGDRISRTVVSGPDSKGVFQPITYDRYTYDGRGNVTKIETFFANNQPLSRLSYEYDTKGNPFRATGRPQFSASFLSPNNITRERYEYFGPSTGTSPNYDRAISYQYAANGYPAQASQDGIVFKYVYQ